MKQIFTNLFTLCVLLLSGALTAQVTVTGSVQDADGMPLIGANIVSVNTSNGTITDIDGNFSLELPAARDSLAFSYTGYLNETVAVGQKRKFRITLRENKNLLDEVIVTAYGTTKRENLIGAVDQVGERKLQNIAVTSFDQALRGMTAGVQLRQGSGTPGAGAEILIRGIGSITAGNQPLVVIDGLPYGNTNDQRNNFLTAINPDDIESITVVRDAAQKALYGSRAAAGLILITTKRGRSGKPTISFSGYTGVQTVPPWERPSILNATELAQFLRERIEDEALVNGEEPEIPDHLEDPSQYGEGTDWYDAITRNGWQNNATLGVRGGSKAVRYNLSMGYLDQEGVIIETDLQRYSFRANMDADITPWLTFGMELAPSWTNISDGNTDPGGGQFSVYNVVNIAQWADPSAPLYDENGQLTTTTEGALLPFFQANPVYKLQQQQDERQNRFTQFGLNLKAKLAEGLSARTRFGVIWINNQGRQFSPGSVVGTGLTPNNPNPVNNSFAAAGRYENLRTISENTLNYTTTFAERHNLSALAGYSAEYTRETTMSASGSRLIEEGFPLFSSGNIFRNDPQTGEPSIFFNAGTGISEQALISYFGRIEYNFDQKYYLIANLRADGSSRFGPNNKFGYFPSVGVSYRVSKEPWFPRSEVLSNLRFEGSFGRNGNNRIGNYRYQGGVGRSDYVFGSVATVGRAINGIPNFDLAWEETTELNVGLDIGLFNDKVNIEIDYFDQVTNGLLYGVPLPRITGFGERINNLGEIQNKGIEISIRSQPVVKERFAWTLDVNASANRNRVNQLGVDDIPIRRTNAGNGTQISWTLVGEPVGQYYGLNILGLYTQEMIDDPDVPKYPGAVVGAPFYEDGDGDGTLEAFQDYVFLGNPFPDFQFGLVSLVSFDEFSLRVIANGEVGSSIFDLQREFMLNTDGVFNNRRDVLDRWRPGSDDFTLRVPTTTSGASSRRYRWPNSVGVVDGTFLKIANVTLTYDLRKVLENQNVFQGASVYASVQNALVFSKFQGNPEVRRARVGSLERNINYGSYPVPRTFTLGFNVRL